MKKTTWLLVTSIVLVISGCATFQSPKVLEKGENSLTAGVSVSYPGWFSVTAAYRTYLAKNLDVGLQLCYKYAFSAIADLKYQILTEPFYLAAGFGAGVGYMQRFYPIVQALLIGGTDVFYIGIKPMYAFEHASEYPIFGGIVAGGTIGKKPSFLIEGNLGYFNMPSVTLGIGLRWVF